MTQKKAVQFVPERLRLHVQIARARQRMIEEEQIKQRKLQALRQQQLLEDLVAAESRLNSNGMAMHDWDKDIQNVRRSIEEAKGAVRTGTLGAAEAVVSCVSATDLDK